MILEVEQAVERVVETLGAVLVDAAIQLPDEAIATHVIPEDGDVVWVNGYIRLDVIARALVLFHGAGRDV